MPDFGLCIEERCRPAGENSERAKSDSESREHDFNSFYEVNRSFW